MMSEEMLESIIFDRWCGYICCTDVVSIEPMSGPSSSLSGKYVAKRVIKLVRYGKYQAGRDDAMMR